MKQNNKPKYKQIIDAAVIVIAENGYHQAQVSKIAKQARVADGTIYLYFKNKEDILVSLFREKMGSFIREMEKEIPSKQTASEKLLMLIEKHFTLLAANNKLAIVTQLELRQSSKQLRYRINEILKRYLDIVDDIISFGKQAGEFDGKLNSKLARQMIFGTIDETVTTWVMNEQKYNLIELAKEVHELLIWGFQKRLFET
ncbi:TetR/AcrR family transcriptional regulator [Metabacillus fastidiosus]|uniref:TetR/AcrR family transcriptional regulator n=1 Tax=Metabacillus fastidiosus TaxID=1458 RepID=UPI003D290825